MRQFIFGNCVLVRLSDSENCFALGRSSDFCMRSPGADGAFFPRLDGLVRLLKGRQNAAPIEIEDYGFVVHRATRLL